MQYDALGDRCACMCEFRRQQVVVLETPVCFLLRLPAIFGAQVASTVVLPLF